MAAALVDYTGAEKELYEFDDLKIGVKGLVETGVTQIPRFFIHPPESRGNNGADGFEIPVIDLTGFNDNDGRRVKMVNAIRDACETWGFFQIVNHGVPLAILEDCIESIRRFHEQPQEAKMEWYSRDFSRKATYYSSGDIKGRAKPVPAEWRDTLSCRTANGQWDFDALPELCRRELEEYIKGIMDAQEKISELMSEALGLNKNYLSNTGYLKSVALSCHYYPPCPEPDLTLGTIRHSDPTLLTFVLQNNRKGLQVLHNDQWVDAQSVDGALVANIGDLMQLLSNDRFKSVEHRVLANPHAKPRISVASFFMPKGKDGIKTYGPIKELLSDNSPPIYRITSHDEFMRHHRTFGQIGQRALPHFKL